MAVIFETLGYFPRWIREDDNENHPFFGKSALGAVNFVKSSSSFARSSVKFADVYYGHHNSKNFSSLGLPSAFNAMSGLLSLKKGYRALKLMNRIEDAFGSALASLSCARAAIQTIGGTLFIPIRTLSFTAYMTESKTAQVVERVLGSFGKGISEVSGGLSLLSSGLEIHEQLSLMLEFNDRPPAELLGDLQVRLQNPAERNAFARVTSQRCADEILAGLPEQAEALMDRAFHEGVSTLSNSALSFALTALGIAATVIVTASAAPQALLVSAGINGFLALFGFAMNLVALAKTMRGNPAQGRHDIALLAALSVASLLALAQTLFMQERLLFQGITSTLGMAWVLVTICAYLKR